MWRLFLHFYVLKFHWIDSYLLSYPWADIILSSNLLSPFFQIFALSSFIPNYEYCLSFVLSKSLFPINLLMIALDLKRCLFRVIYFIWIRGVEWYQNCRRNIFRQAISQCTVHMKVPIYRNIVCGERWGVRTE